MSAFISFFFFFFEVESDLCVEQSSTYAAIQIASNCRVFKNLSDDDTPKTAVHLAEAGGADPSMLG